MSPKQHKFSLFSTQLSVPCANCAFHRAETLFWKSSKGISFKKQVSFLIRMLRSLVNVVGRQSDGMESEEKCTYTYICIHKYPLVLQRKEERNDFQ